MASTSGARRRPQKYPDELRERAVRMVLEVQRETGERHGAVTRIATQLGVGAESLRNWVRQAEVDTGRRPGTSSVNAQRIAQLERENRELRRANAFTDRGFHPIPRRPFIRTVDCMASPSTLRTSRHRWFVAFAAVGICLALAGCGASTTKGDGNPPLSSESATSTAPDVPVSSSAATTAATTAAASTASASVASSSSAPPVQPKTTDDGCSVLSDDEVTAVIGVPVTRREASAESAGSFGCVKGNDRATDLTQAAFVSFSAFTAGGVALLDELAGQGGTEEISGLGERALYQAAGGFVFVLQGGTVVSVQVYKFGAPGSRDEVIGLARIALSRVP